MIPIYVMCAMAVSDRADEEKHGNLVPSCVRLANIRNGKNLDGVRVERVMTRLGARLVAWERTGTGGANSFLHRLHAQSLTLQFSSPKTFSSCSENPV